MRIAVWYNLPSGGAKRALHDHVKGLVGLGHTVEAWCPPTSNQTYWPLGDLVKQHIVPLHESAPSKSTWRQIDKRHGFLFDKMRHMEEHSANCAKAIDAGNFDVLFANTCQFYGAPQIARFIRRTKKVLYLQEPHRAYYEAWPLWPWSALPDAYMPRHPFERLQLARRLTAMRIKAREEQMNAQAFDRILVNSYFSRETLLRVYALDSQVCYLGIDTNKFVHKNSPREKFIVGVGSFSPNKNISFVIESLAQIPKLERPSLVWLGNSQNDSGYLDGLKRQADQQEVVFKPKTDASDENIVEILNQGYLMVYAPNLEPFGYVPLEANACGMPVVAVAEAGVRETIVDGVNGLVVDNTTQAVAQAVLKLLRDEKLYQTLSKQAVNRIKAMWSLDDSTNRLNEHLVSLAAISPSLLSATDSLVPSN